MRPLGRTTVKSLTACAAFAALLALGLSVATAGTSEDAECRGVPATIVAGQGAFLRGTSGPDVILAGAGFDAISARGGRDRICAGRGNDYVKSGPGGDVVFGDRGNDDVFGGGGTDVVRGGPDRDYLEGGDGRGDLCRGGPPASHEHRRGDAADRRSCERITNAQPVRLEEVPDSPTP
jgi:hypothetical protein